MIARERPDALLPTMGGQTALNVARELAVSGVLDRWGCELIGARLEAIEKAEDREKFRDAMRKIGLEVPKSAVARSMEEARAALAVTGLPAIVRPSYTLGGTGGGVAYNVEEFEEIARAGLDASPIHEILVEESVLGWKEFEMEVVRDRADNCIIVCSIENLDPMGVHTGDSITIAPALTLTDREYQRMRDASIAVLREIGVDTGGSNVQFAIDPKSGRMVVIEMNPRVSRSSALASKATGFPIAKVAARLAVGYTLDEILNDITGVTPASFEPSIDYVVVKMPRFAFEKFPETEPVLTTSMKSVGEVMAIGRSFQEALQKALRGLETGLSGLDEIDPPGAEEDRRAALEAALARPTPDRLRLVAQAFREGVELPRIHELTAYDPWFLERIRELVEIEEALSREGLPRDAEELRRLKALGFSDRRLARLAGLTEEEVRAHRRRLGVVPVYKRVDTCAAEFPSRTAYMYGTYEFPALAGEPPEDEAEPSDRDKVIILGGGPNRIGQGIEFDYCCVHAAFALREAGIETVMVNCNPETVSTDPDTSDRLYFEPLTAEDVLEICRVEASRGRLLGVIVQLGGQTPLKLCRALEREGVPILGTSPDSIDLAEDRDRFQRLLRELELRQPESDVAYTLEEALARVERIGLPVLIRPSYVLGGRAMRIVSSLEELREFFAEAAAASEYGPVLIDRYLQDATEVDVDVVADAGGIYVAGIMEHIEEAGIHSGDSACSLPPFSLPAELRAEIARQARLLARALDVRGLMNVQMAIKDGIVYVLEVNPRASRTVPFVAKATGVPVAKIATRVMAGEPLAGFGLMERELPHMAVKEAVFPFNRFPGVDLILGPEMKSTGEVMGLDRDFGAAFLKSQIAAGNRLPASGTVFLSVRDADKPALVEIARELARLGYRLVATSGTAGYLREHGLEVETVFKVHEGRRPHVVDRLKNREIDLVVNTVEGGKAMRDSYSLRRTTLQMGIPYYTTIAGARAMVRALARLREGGIGVAPLQSYYAAIDSVPNP
ncbi:Carbamoyl-phosphate synthase large chain [bacterium HR39]|nr:Carbamoyl-phosphate synthase large chain [bacterium HR39]